jgi:hypothetical protein
MRSGIVNIAAKQAMIKKRIFILFLISLLLADTGYSFLQHYHTPFDGDMAGGIVPGDNVKPVLESPLGLKVFKEHVAYANPNRFFCHWGFYQYFNRAPLVFQNSFSPISAAYMSCAFAKTVIQVTILFFLAFFVAGRFLKFEFWVAALFIAPLFQTNGYRGYMGIIDPSTTYVFFYALPAILLLLYFAPLLLNYFYNFDLKRLKYVQYLWIPLALVSSLSGPLNPGVSLVVCLMVFGYCFIRNLRNSNEKGSFTRLKYAMQNIPGKYYFYLIPLSFFSAYSLFLGHFNIADLTNDIPLTVLYSRLPQGIYYPLTQKIGYPLLLGVLALNTLIIYYRLRTPEGQKVLKAFKWVGLFALIYIVLLPLGGYRYYRPYIIRYDTIIPITLCLMFIFGKTTLFILKNLSKAQRYAYLPVILLVMYIFTNADKPEFEKNECERSSLMQISKSPAPVVKLTTDCTVVSWGPVGSPQESALQAALLKRWGIIGEEKRFYQEKEGR